MQVESVRGYRWGIALYNELINIYECFLEDMVSEQSKLVEVTLGSELYKATHLGSRWKW